MKGLCFEEGRSSVGVLRGREHRNPAEQEADNHLALHIQFAREERNCSEVDKGLRGADIAVLATQLIEEQPGLGQYGCRD
jgi:hypothetical protein